MKNLNTKVNALVSTLSAIASKALETELIHTNWVDINIYSDKEWNAMVDGVWEGVKTQLCLNPQGFTPEGHYVSLCFGQRYPVAPCHNDELNARWGVRIDIEPKESFVTEVDRFTLVRFVGTAQEEWIETPDPLTGRPFYVKGKGLARPLRTETRTHTVTQMGYSVRYKESSLTY